MTSSTLRIVDSGAELRPVDGSERLALLDALRGFALCGVFISNVFLWFSGRIFLPRPQIEAALAHASWLDFTAIQIFGTLIFGKFITLFSFLFGLGFAVQMGRAEARGASVVPLYARRLTVMLGLGVTHLFLVWYGDILSTYAVLGFGLLLFRSRKDRTLLAWAAGLILVSPLIGMVLGRLPQLLGSHEAAMAMAKQATARSEAIRAATLEGFSQSSYLGMLRANARFYLDEMLRMSWPALLALLGRFLLGLMAGRSRLFHDASTRLPLFRKLLVWGLVVGGLASAVTVTVQQLAMRKLIHPEAMPWLPFVMMPSRQLADVGLATVYLSGFTLLFQREVGRRVLSLLAPVGRMALTNYLAQSVISVFVYDGLGLGLMGRIGPAASIALTLCIFGVQVAWSHLWLSRYRFGPAEWLWRSLTYGKPQPMRLAPEPRVRPLTAG